MTIARYTTLVCDGTQGLECRGQTPVVKTLEEARQLATERGWVGRRVNGRTLDLCPSCSTVVGKPTKKRGKK